MSNKEEKFVHPKKWRETCDPFSLNYSCFKPIEVLGYPHAGNDVFHVIGEYKGKKTFAYVKAERQKGASVDNELKVIRQIKGFPVPEVLDYSLTLPVFIVTREMPGKRLSVIARENEGLLSLKYMKKYGEALGKIHSIKDINAEVVKDRSFFHAPTKQMLDEMNLSYLEDYFSKKPLSCKTVFCHADFHYANVLWQGGEISAILDFELAGFGDRDYDIAWSTALRPGQTFFKTAQEMDAFLKGYSAYGEYDLTAIKYYTAQIYVHFLSFNQKNEDYSTYVRDWLNKNCR